MTATSDQRTWLACWVCAVAVPDATVVTYRDITEVSPAGFRGPDRLIDLGLCDLCAAEREQVRRILTAHPGLSRALGPGGAESAVTSVVQALAVLNMPPPDFTRLTAEDLTALIHHLQEPGTAVPYRLRAQTGQSGPYRFALLPSDRLDALRSAYGAYLHERAMRHAPPVRLAPPGRTTGCLFCGLDVVTLPAAHVARVGLDQARAWVWRTASPPQRTLGGQGEDRVPGHLCPACSEERDAVGAWGPTALTKAWAAYLRSTGAEQVARAIEQADSIDGLIAWGVSGQPPSRTPWAHLEPPE